MEGWAAALIASVAGVILVAVLTAGGYLIRRSIASLDALRAEVRAIAERVTTAAAVSPLMQSKLDDLGEVVTENTQHIAVLREWKRDHDRYHERQVITRSGQGV